MHFGGELDVSLIELMENLGLDDVRLDKIRHLESNGGDYCGKRYVDSDIETIIGEAIENDVEIRVIKVARNTQKNSIKLLFQAPCAPTRVLIS